MSDMVLLLKWPKRSTFQYELWIWRICPPGRYCVWEQNWKYCKSVNIIENKNFAKVLKFGQNCEISVFFCFFELVKYKHLFQRILWTNLAILVIADCVEMTRPFQVYFGIVLIKDILYQAQISFWKVEKYLSVKLTWVVWHDPGRIRL